MVVRRAGDAMLIVEFEAVIDPLVNQYVIDLGGRLEGHAFPGVRDIVPGYCSLGVHFDPLRTDLAALEQAIADEGRVAAAVAALPAARVHEIPVEYGGAAGPDLEAVAAFAGCSTNEVVERHAAAIYRVYTLGFVPGFAYLGGVDRRIAAPRRRVPRERVPAGSVGIAGEQTGVYPLATPGGWQIIGRTSEVLFDAARTPANLLAPGDAVRFVPR
ncbi:MAG TPA: 5-oxoprolinase subunit PxpB [Vicinamibacterales bacterium]|nr:5-oxoprolinase subunit PxpB [Vicinamibacterales bacterium]